MDIEQKRDYWRMVVKTEEIEAALMRWICKVNPYNPEVGRQLLDAQAKVVSLNLLLVDIWQAMGYSIPRNVPGILNRRSWESTTRTFDDDK